MCEISVILPVYNKARYLNALFSALRAQCFPDFECLVIDDGSTDGSAELCDAAAACDHRFRVTHCANGGVSRARNLGLSQAQGRFLTFIDADDRVQPEYLQRLYNGIISSGADMALCGYTKLWEDGRTAFSPPLPYTGLRVWAQLLPEFAQVQQESGLYGFCWGKLLRRELAQGVIFPESLRLAEDFAFYLRIYPRVETIFFVTDCRYGYLQEAENSTALIGDAKIDYLAQLQICLHYREFLQSARAYSGENRKIVERRLAEYCYFSVFHAPRAEVVQRVHQLHALSVRKQLPTVGRGVRQRLLLRCVRTDRAARAKRLLALYDFLRGIKRREE